MLEAIRKAVPAVSPVSMDVILAVGTFATFMWLLVNGYVRPLAIYLLELYLAL
ncbi:MAG: hypothetical protein ACE5GX_11205 [Thermoanaerobaculia bacterium]